MEPLDGPVVPASSLVAGDPTHAARLSAGKIALILAGNLVPLLGVLLLKWNLVLVLLLYWAETGVLGLYGLLWMAARGGPRAFFMVPFFCVHFGAFMAGHLFFLLFALPSLGSFGNHPAPFDRGFSNLGLLLSPVVGLAVAGFALQHGVAFAQRLRDPKESLQAGGPAGAMKAMPYGRIVIMQVAIIFGAYGIMMSGTQLIPLVILIIGKTAGEVGFALREQRTAPATRPVGSEPA